MGSALSASQINALNSISPKAVAAGASLGTLLDEILTAQASGSSGITADAWDVDSVAKDGGQFSLNEDDTSGLNLALYGGRLFNGLTTITVGASTTALSASNTNYVECSRAGVVSQNTAGFTTGSIPLYLVTTGVSSITTIVNVKCFLASVPNGGITGNMLSSAGRTITIDIFIGDIAATKTVPVQSPSFGVTLTRASLMATGTVAGNDTNYYTFALTNKTSSGSGTTAMLAATDANTMKATGGSGVTANVPRVMTLHGTGANLDTAANDGLIFTATLTGSGVTLSNASLKLEFTFTG